MSTRLEVDGREVYLGGTDVALRTPGLEGEAEILSVGVAASRSGLADRFDELAGASGFESDLVVAIHNAQEVDLPGAEATRSTHYGDPGIELEVPAPAPGWGQVLLHSDEAGLTTWHFAEPRDGEGPATRGSDTNVFVVPRAPDEPEPGEEGTSRGAVGQIGMRILKVFSFKLVSAAGGALGAAAVRDFERKKRPYGVRPFGPTDFQRGVAAAHQDSGFWQDVAAGRALLFVHGTFSRSDWAFEQIEPEVMKELDQRYAGRLFAFDHPTLAQDPGDNAAWFLDNLRSPGPLDLDVVCHSRGGLVSRQLARELAASGRGRVGRIVFVAAPNAGTVLTDMKYVRQLIDVFTNLLSFLPDTGVVEAFEAVFELVKEVAAGTVTRLAGLQAMCPGGAFLESLNGGPRLADTRCFALTSDYEPSRPAGWKSWTRNLLADTVFGEHNDLVVPTRGVFEGSGAGFPRFADGDWKVLARQAEVAHTGYFADASVRGALLDWLRGATD